MSPLWPGDNSNIAWLLWHAAESAGSRTAMISDHRSLDYGSLAGRAAQTANALVDVGVEPGDRVVVLLWNGPEAAAALFGVTAAGAIAVSAHANLRPRQVEHILRHSGATVLLTSESLLQHQPRTLDAPGTRVVAVDRLASPSEFRPIDRAARDPAQVVYTSGSTGQPKGVIISHGALWASAASVRGYLGIESDDRIGTILPFSFTYGFNQLLIALNARATLVVEHSILPHTIVDNLRERAISVFGGIPSTWLQLLGVAGFREQSVDSLRVITNAGGHLPKSVVRALRKAQPQARLFLMYGMTEVIRSTYLDPSQVDQRPDSMGKAVEGAEVLVLRDDLTPCEPGEVGELVHCGPTVALGYWNDPEATARTFRPDPRVPDGAAHRERVVFSGDLVRADEEGYLYFVGRRDRLFKSLGYRVSPDEVLEVLHASGEVRDAAVVPEPDEQWGQRVVAHVVLQDREGCVERLNKYCRMELPRYLQPARFEVWNELPRLPSGKHDLSALQDRATGA